MKCGSANSTLTRLICRGVSRTNSLIFACVEIDKFEKKFGSLKYKTENFNFRERIPDKEMSPKQFKVSNYMTPAEKINKALEEGKLMTQEKYVNKR